MLRDDDSFETRIGKMRLVTHHASVRIDRYASTAAIINVLADAFKRMAIAISMVTAPSIFMEFFIKPPLCVVTSLKCVYVMRVHAYT